MKYIKYTLLLVLSMLIMPNCAKALSAPDCATHQHACIDCYYELKDDYVSHIQVEYYSDGTNISHTNSNNGEIIYASKSAYGIRNFDFGDKDEPAFKSADGTKLKCPSKIYLYRSNTDKIEYVYLSTKQYSVSEVEESFKKLGLNAKAVEVIGEFKPGNSKENGLPIMEGQVSKKSYYCQADIVERDSGCLFNETARVKSDGDTILDVDFGENKNNFAINY